MTIEELINAILKTDILFVVKCFVIAAVGWAVVIVGGAFAWGRFLFWKRR